MTSGLLGGARVVEIAHPLTEYAGLLWAGLGAEVWLVEPPQGAAARWRRPRMREREERSPRMKARESTRASMPFLARNVGKKSVVVDPRSAADRQLLHDLIERADVLLAADGAPYLSLPKAPVTVRVTDRLGLGVSSIVGFAASGGMASSGWPQQPPCNAPSWLALDGAGMYAAVMAAVGLFATRRGGGSAYYEVPFEEAAVASITPWTRCLHSYDMQAAGQGAQTARLGPTGFPIYETNDGYVRILAGTPKQWQAFVRLLGEPEEIVSGPFSDPEFRRANHDALQLLCADLIRQRSMMELFTAGQQHGLTISPVYSLNQFRADRHVRERKILNAMPDAEFEAYETVRTPLLLQPEALNAAQTPAPGLDEHAAEARAVVARPAPDRCAAEDADFDSARPLAGVRILELGVGAVVPEAASLLALLGAEVIKLESLVHVDFLRRNGLAGAMDVNNSPTFNQLNLGVQSLAIDMTTPEGVAVAQRLAARCDAVMENMRGPVVRRWGLDYETLRSSIREDVVYLGSQGLGRGPYDGFQTYGPNLQTFSGITHQWSHPDDPFPVGTTLNHPDHIAGKQALVAFLAALLRRRETGQGCFIDATQMEAAAFLIGDRHLRQSVAAGEVAPLGNRSLDMAPHGCYRCADDAEGNERWLAMAVEDDAQWRKLKALIDDDRLALGALDIAAGRLARADSIDEAVAAWVRSRTVDDAEAALRSAGICASRVVTGDDMAATDTSFFPALAHPTSGLRRYTGVPVLLDGEHRLAMRRPPLLGEHTERVLHDVLELPPQEIDRLTAARAVGH